MASYAKEALSWANADSAAYLNNDNAKLLEKYMTATGMRGLSSEWWHFQDDETRPRLWAEVTRARKLPRLKRPLLVIIWK